MWKFTNFSDTWILCEINFDDIKETHFRKMKSKVNEIDYLPKLISRKI